jgi:serine/threonine protein kinase
MVTADGTVKLLDFGVAKILAECELDETQNVRGKFSYMAPEQLRGEPFDRRVDVFAAGIVLHEMLTGRRLFYRPHVEDTLQAVESAEIPPPSAVNREVPEALDRVVLRALERDLAMRWRGAEEMADALHAIRGFELSRRDFVERLAAASPEEESTLEMAAPSIMKG